MLLFEQTINEIPQKINILYTISRQNEFNDHIGPLFSLSTCLHSKKREYSIYSKDFLL